LNSGTLVLHCDDLSHVKLLPGDGQWSAHTVSKDITMVDHSLSVLGAACLLLALPGITNAVGLGQNQKSGSTIIEEIVVTAERQPGSLTARGEAAAREALSRVPGAIGFVGAEEFADDFAQSIGDTLVFTPGVFADTSAQRENRISVRGSGLNSSFERRGIALYRDGIPVTRASGSTEFQEVDPVTVQYLEVHKGANGLRYGGSSLGGVINMVTPTGITAADMLSLRVEGGDFDTRRASASLAHAWDQVDIFAAYTRLDSSGYRDHSAVDSHYGFANIGVKLGERAETRTYLTLLRDNFELAGSLSLVDALRDESLAARPVTIRPFFPGGPTTVVDPGPVGDDWDRNLKVLRLSNVTRIDLDHFGVNAGTWYSKRKLDHAITRFAGIIDQDEKEGGVLLRADGPLTWRGRDGEWTVGMEANKAWNHARTWANRNGRRDALTSDADQTSWNGVVYAQLDVPLTDRWSGIVGVQAARNSRRNEAILNNVSGRALESQINPRFGILWNPAESTTLFVNVTRGYEPPTVADLTAGGALPFTPLKAQRAWTYEIGGRGQIGALAWDIALYHSTIEDELLDYGLAVGPRFISFTDNGTDTVHQGLELGFDYAIAVDALSKRGLALTLRQIYTFNDFRFESDPAFDDNRLAGVPRHLYIGEFRLDSSRGWYAATNFRWVPDGAYVDFANTTDSPGYNLLGVTAGWDVTEHVRIFVSGENLTDQHYISNVGTNANQLRERAALFTPGQGRAWFGGFTVSLQQNPE